MGLLVLVFGIILIVAALRDTQGSLATALMRDVPGYLDWMMAILAVGIIGYLPKMEPVSRALMTLVVVVIFLKNYQNVITGFEGLGNTVAPTVPGYDNGLNGNVNSFGGGLSSNNSTVDLGNLQQDATVASIIAG